MKPNPNNQRRDCDTRNAGATAKRQQNQVLRQSRRSQSCWVARLLSRQSRHHLLGGGARLAGLGGGEEMAAQQCTPVGGLPLGLVKVTPGKKSEAESLNAVNRSKTNKTDTGQHRPRAGQVEALRPDHGASGVNASRPASPTVSNPSSASTATWNPYGLPVLNMKTDEMNTHMGGHAYPVGGAPGQCPASFSSCWRKG